MNNFYLTLVMFTLLPSWLMSVDIAITIDDYPMSDGYLFSSQKRTEAFLNACSKHHCKAAFFCIGQDCNTEKGKFLLALLDNNGHFLANHSMTHSHFSSKSLVEFESEIRQTEAILSSYQNMRKWFRYPFLDYGNRDALGGSKEKSLRSIEILRLLGYVEGYVTINTLDWHINERLRKSLKQGNSVDFHSLKTLYLNLLKEWCNHYIRFYQVEFPEEITHTLLLHANDLNALYLQDILLMIKDSGWNIVSPEQAFANTSWRKNILEHLVIFNKPTTLDTQEIDKLLDINNIFDRNTH